MDKDYLRQYNPPKPKLFVPIQTNYSSNMFGIFTSEKAALDAVKFHFAQAFSEEKACDPKLTWEEFLEPMDIEIEEFKMNTPCCFDLEVYGNPR